MEWWLPLVVIMGSLLLLMASGLHTAFCFLLINIVGVYFLWNGQAGLRQLIISMSSAITVFSLMAVILYVLMGSVLFQSGVASRVIDAVSKLLGRLPGRLGLIAVISGTLFAALSGSSMGSTAMLGSVLIPEMEKHGYKKSMSIGPILASGPLAILIPPSSLAVVLAVLSEVSVGRLLIASIVPGLIIAAFYFVYIMVRCWLQPSLAPAYETGHYAFSERVSDLGKYVVPLAFIIFLVTGLVFLGVATPSESAAVGCLGAFIVAAAYKKFNWSLIKKSVTGSVQTASMVLIIMASATAFSQVLSSSGASQGMIKWVLSQNMAPIVFVIATQVVVFIMGCFMDVSSIMLITVPLFMPIVRGVGFDPIWFATIMLVNIELAVITPPFGLTLFVMKGVAPPDTKMEDIYRAGIPFIGIQLFVMALLIVFPIIPLWLPGMMMH